MVVVSAGAHAQHFAAQRHRPLGAVSLDPGVLQSRCFAKYAVALPRMSRSIFTRANSARSRAISICSELTGLLPAPPNRPCRSALIQLCSVCSANPRIFAVAAMLWLLIPEANGARFPVQY